MNKLIVIGYLSNRYCYLNLPSEECIKRYCKSEDMTYEEFKKDQDLAMDEFTFTDEFGAYEAYQTQ